MAVVTKTCDGCGKQYRGYANTKWDCCSDVCIQRVKRAVEKPKTQAERTFWYRKKSLNEMLDTPALADKRERYLYSVLLLVADGESFYVALRKAYDAMVKS